MILKESLSQHLPISGRPNMFHLEAWHALQELLSPQVAVSAFCAQLALFNLNPGKQHACIVQRDSIVQGRDFLRSRVIVPKDLSLQEGPMVHLAIFVHQAPFRTTLGNHLVYLARQASTAQV